MARAQGFLSYTHIDDEFFSGAITALRHFLELGVQVVTGDRDFRIFQDREGIELGQQWQKRLEEAIATASLLIPVLTPCFFRSQFCRDELARFLRHEAALGRDDLILPIYFVTVPSLEKRELMETDDLARTIAARQRFDWRAQADLPLTEVQVRRAARELCERIAAAIERTTAPGAGGAEPLPAPPREAGASASSPIIARPPWVPRGGVVIANPNSAHARAARTAPVLHGGFPVVRPPPAPAAATPLSHGEDADAEMRAAEARLQGELSGKEQAPARWSVLWVDDQPDNNRFEASALREYGVQVTQATSTEQALALLDARDSPDFGAVISDMNRPPDRQAGYTLLRALREAGRDVPFLIYARPGDARHAREARRHGGQGHTNSAVELIEMVLRAVRATKGPG